MKKIIIILFLLLLITPVCSAQEENIIEPGAESEIEAPQDTEVLPQEESAEVDNIFTNDPQSNIELQGYLEYSEPTEDTIYLDNPNYKSSLKLKAPPRIDAASLIPSKIKQSPYSDPRRLGIASKFSDLEYSIAPVSTSFGGKSGKFSVGTVYNSSLDSSQLNFSTGVFTKYDGKYVALKTTFAKSTKNYFETNSDKIYFAPEFKITKKLSILNVAQFDVMQPTRKNTVVLRYSPSFKGFADDVQFEVGAGQSFSENTQVNSTLEFSTKFKL